MRSHVKIWKLFNFSSKKFAFGAKHKFNQLNFFRKEDGVAHLKRRFHIRCPKQSYKCINQNSLWYWSSAFLFENCNETTIISCCLQLFAFHSKYLCMICGCVVHTNRLLILDAPEWIAKTVSFFRVEASTCMWLHLIQSASQSISS